jgi:tetratricopeptide (TPR) repeat protein
LGSKKGMAENYANLGVLYQMKGDTEKAIAFLEKALQLAEALGSKEGMARNYDNLGQIYRRQDNKAEAKRYFKKSLDLYKQLRSPTVKDIQTALDELQ